MPGEANELPKPLQKLIDQTTQEDFNELASEIRGVIDRMTRLVCPSCGAPDSIYRDDDAHFQFKPTCPVARFRPLVRKFLPQSGR